MVHPAVLIPAATASGVSGAASRAAAPRAAAAPPAAPRTSEQGGSCSGPPIPILPRPRTAASLLLAAITSGVSAAASRAAAAIAIAAAPPPPPPRRKSGSLVPILPRPSPDGQSASAAGRGRSDARTRGLFLASGRSPGRGGAKRARKSSYNKQCTKCNQAEEKNEKRFKLCKDRFPECERWVHKKHCLPFFNTFAPPSERCCKHHGGFKTKCCCRPYVHCGKRHCCLFAFARSKPTQS